MPTAAASGTFPIAGELEVNRLGFGAMRLTGPGITGPARRRRQRARRPAPRRRARRQPHRHRRRVRPGRQRGAHRRGAPSVPGRPRHRDEGRPGATGEGGEWPKDGRPEHLREACEGSLRRLRVDAIDVYYLHRPDPTVPYEESVGALKELKDEGKIRHVAVSNVERGAARESPAGSSTSPSSRTSTASTDRRSQDVLDTCAERGSGSSRGRRSTRARSTRPGRSRRSRAPRRDAAADRPGVAAARSPAMLPIPGTSSLGHLEENIAAAEIELAADELAALDALGG